MHAQTTFVVREHERGSNGVLEWRHQYVSKRAALLLRRTCARGAQKRARTRLRGVTRAKQRVLSFEIPRDISFGGSVFDRDFEKSKFLEIPGGIDF